MQSHKNANIHTYIHTYTNTHLGKRMTFSRVCKWLSDVKYSLVRTQRPKELMPMSSA